uniref:Peptidase S8/S53 domain-containing protein n=1 Tax=Ditylenchus dipsaci TaxID=166011 RepID=A0A915EN97_9BILA
MSISWGPKDDGKTAEKPGRLSQMALEKGVNEGRNGSGTIYVWASGNGGLVGDDCAADGYASSVHSFTVSAVASDGSVPWASDTQSVVTTNPGNTCTQNHTGTSAATPIAVGIIALGLEANPQLTWRDIQHIAVWTADPSPSFTQTKRRLENERGWISFPS